ncbi:tRNA (guanosine(37)-N1)-methyltransferase TrmD [Austwickia chelonae]|uniref:tRNA (guanosine(37)-N1)-methyltransferase TrmD n=1 Tax=Austwickia chelonae TaxID=100225 RepID=UPI000E23C8B5|nr:tRNA (guanosine(37)-N1)-methyltransferase TrmD [Austwickia chelonae]
MRIDVATIFPDYLSPLKLSLIGKAQVEGLLDIRVHDLRDHTHDRHRTVDDSPYGGGAGMVMKPEPWGELLDSVLDTLGSDCPEDGPVLVVPGPGGRPLTQAMAYELAREPWLMFACGRYEGIDERVYSYAQECLGEDRVRLVSLGDYVLNGGEVATLAVIEAVARLLPGVIGNEESLTEESHTGGLLEYPVYTKPASWRGREVPQILLSGDHGKIARWRHEERLSRTAQRRPDLLPSAAVLCGEHDLSLSLATPGDAGELFTLTRSCWVTEAQLNGDLSIPPLTESLEEIRNSLLSEAGWQTWILRDPASGRLVASVRGRLVRGSRDAENEARTWEVGRLMVAPDLTGRGLGRALLSFCLEKADARATRAWLMTGRSSERNQRIYKKAGFRVCRGEPQVPGTLEMECRLV